MIEYPEAMTLAKQLSKEVIGKTVEQVYPPSKMHKFCWFNGEPKEYSSRLQDHIVQEANGFGIFVELEFSEGLKLCVNDGVNVRLIRAADIPKNYQLLIVFTDGTALLFTVAMYGGIILHTGDYDNEYYLKSYAACSPLDDEFEKYYYKIYRESKSNLSAKAFLATEQRFPGIGNGVLQDILFDAGIHPKRKIDTLSEEETKKC